MIYTDATWYHGDSFCVSTDRGDVFVFDAAECTSICRNVFSDGIVALLAYRDGIITAGANKRWKVFTEGDVSRAIRRMCLT